MAIPLKLEITFTNESTPRRKPVTLIASYETNIPL